MSGSFGNFFDQIKSGAKSTASQMSKAAKIAKLRVEMATQKTERERHLKTIGTKVYAIYQKDKNLDVDTVTNEVKNELNLIERIDNRTVEIQDEISTLQSEMRNEGGSDVVDAEVADSDDEEEAEEKPKKKSKKKPEPVDEDEESDDE
ncbi:MAG: hypothetical protein U0105_16980 [Candidatus Obscuribacterales bacterium]